MNHTRIINEDAKSFYQGKNFFAYDYFGCHVSKSENVYKYIFRVWAPNADSVYLVSDFTSWDVGVPLNRINDYGIWEISYESVEDLNGKFYKFKIVNDMEFYYKSDPYAFYSQALTETASIVSEIDGFMWSDDNWLSYRKKSSASNKPINIYEVHLSSWRTKNHNCSSNDVNHYLNYREIADEIAPYVKKMGYTHVQLMPIFEHALDNDMGYKVFGYFAPTSCFGAPYDFMYLVNKLHECGIGVILDWSPICFAENQGLYRNDGDTLYEYVGQLKTDTQNKKTVFFDVGKKQVKSFLISCALFWIRKYHIDGFHLSNTFPMLENLFEQNDCNGTFYKSVIEFYRDLNHIISNEFDDTLIYGDINGHLIKDIDNLGLDYVCNKKSVSNALVYMEESFNGRKYKYDSLTSSVTEMCENKYVMCISHDAVSNGKKSLVDKMFGNYNEKFASIRALLTYIMTIPSKKLLFMGTEFAQFKEWVPHNQLEWFLLEHQKHSEVRLFISELNHFYLDNSELWELDGITSGFEWIERNQADINVLSYKRKALDSSELIVVINFSPTKRENYRINVDQSGNYREVFSSDEARFGGTGNNNKGIIKSAKYLTQTGKFQNYIDINLPALSGVIFHRINGRVRRV